MNPTLFIPSTNSAFSPFSRKEARGGRIFQPMKMATEQLHLLGEWLRFPFKPERSKLERYRVAKYLESGACAKTLQAFDRVNQRWVAIKINHTSAYHIEKNYKFSGVQDRLKVFGNAALNIFCEMKK